MNKLFVYVLIANYRVLYIRQRRIAQYLRYQNIEILEYG